MEFLIRKIRVFIFKLSFSFSFCFCCCSLFFFLFTHSLDCLLLLLLILLRLLGLFAEKFGDIVLLLSRLCFLKDVAIRVIGREQSLLIVSSRRGKSSYRVLGGLDECFEHHLSFILIINSSH